MAAKLFDDNSQTVISFKSTWHRDRNLKSEGIQTKPSEAKTVDVQSYQRNSVGVQTISADQTADQLTFTQTDLNQLAKFLVSIEPSVVKALRDNLKTKKAFDAFANSWNSDQEIVVQNSHTLKHSAVEENMQAISVCWNASGTTIAVGYAAASHEDWCTHRANICIWNIERKSLNPSRADSTIEVDACVSSTAFHPSTPALLTGGLVDGSIYVWNLSIDSIKSDSDSRKTSTTPSELKLYHDSDGDSMVASSKPTDFGHKDAVTSLSWLGASNRLEKQQNQLVSTGRDGKVLVWLLPSRGSDLQIVQTFMLLLGSLPRSLRGGSGSEKEAGISAATFAPKEQEIFAIGTETGGVCQCSLASRDPVTISANYVGATDVPVFSPVTLPLQPHKGPVYCLKASPFQPSLFASGSADGALRLYHLLKTEPLLVIEPDCGSVYALSWSFCRSLVIAGAFGSGRVGIFDFTFSHVSPVVWLDVAKQGVAVLSLAFNPKQPSVLATADADGVIKVWQLTGERFTTQAPQEEKQLAELLNTNNSQTN